MVGRSGGGEGKEVVEGTGTRRWSVTVDVVAVRGKVRGLARARV